VTDPASSGAARFRRAEDIERWPRVVLTIALVAIGVVAWRLGLPDLYTGAIFGAGLSGIRPAVSPWLTRLGRNGNGAA
jgi:hypothetical protein